MSDPLPRSEVGPDPPLLQNQSNSASYMEQQMSLFASGMETIFQKISENINPPPSNTLIPIKLLTGVP
ncbi:unnamed protein product [Euphydryas editha]|uniref:Uncharacterized protein n=1 Tax=Euphydryas editha TaxID=104508 RepID=A0AAU9UTT8_EUPED|nr:unnamed protein product [Euphydryas editha]